MLSSNKAWIWPQIEIKSSRKLWTEAIAFLSVAVFLQTSHLTPDVSNVKWSWVCLDVHEERHVRALWLMWWGAYNLLPGAVRESRREECRELRRAGGFGGFLPHLFWGVQGLLVLLLVVENCLSRNLKLGEEEGKKGVRVQSKAHFPIALFLMFTYHVMNHVW